MWDSAKRDLYLDERDERSYLLVQSPGKNLVVTVTEVFVTFSGGIGYAGQRMK